MPLMSNLERRSPGGAVTGKGGPLRCCCCCCCCCSDRLWLKDRRPRPRAPLFSFVVVDDVAAASLLLVPCFRLGEAGNKARTAGCWWWWWWWW